MPVRIRPETMSRLNEWCRRTGLPVDELLRGKIEEHLKRVLDRFETAGLNEVMDTAIAKTMEEA